MILYFELLRCISHPSSSPPLSFFVSLQIIISLQLSRFRLRNLRSVDRKINEMRYPTLFYPEVYLLDGGYSNFYRMHPEHCEPRGYVEMQDVRFVSRCEDDLSQSRKTWKRHKSFAEVGSLGRRSSASF